MLTVVQTGTYSSLNKGDAAMELSTARCLRAALGGARVLVSSPFPELDGSAYPGFEVIASRRRKLGRGTLLLGQAVCRSALHSVGVEMPSRLLFDSELRAMASADLVVDLSGDMLTEDYGVHVAYSHYLPILDAFALGRPVVICAQSVGPFRWTAAIARYIFERADLVTLRDSISMGHLERIGVKNANVHLTADMAFLLEPADTDRASAISDLEGIDWKRRPVLGVSLSGLIRSHYERHNPSARAHPFVSLIAKALDALSETLDVDVIFFPHVTGPGANKDDRVIAAQVQRAMVRPSLAIRGDYGPDELKALIGRCQLFLGARMHANIAALSSQVPTVAISYSHKTQGIMDTLGQAARVIPISDLTEGRVQDAIREIQRARNEIRKALNDGLPEVVRAAQRNVDLIVELVGRRGLR